MSKLGSGFFRNALFLAALLLSSAASSSESVLAQGLNQNWEESSLVLSMPGGSGETLLLGEYYQVLVTAKSDGYLYLVQQNSQERSNGKVRLVPVSNKVPGYRDGAAFMYPAYESIEARPPLGLANVQAVFTDRPLPLDKLGHNIADGQEITLSEESFLALIESVQAADPSLRIALKTFAYEVALADGELEHTTRGIARQINTAITSADLEPDNDGILTSFDAHIQFEFGSPVPTFNGQLQLDAFGDVLTRPEFVDIPFIVAGHTDDIGDEDFNLSLSDARAKAVTDYLQENYGIPPSRVVVKAFGEDEPYVDNVDSTSRALNRRVEFTLLQ